MKKIKIINGAQCTGKSSELKRMLSEWSDESKLVVDTKTFLQKRFKPTNIVELIAVDEIPSKKLLRCLDKAIELNKDVVLVTTDSLSGLPKSYLSKVNVITCNLSV